VAVGQHAEHGRLQGLGHAVTALVRALGWLP
jgi:hypothetical protein